MKPHIHISSSKRKSIIKDLTSQIIYFIHLELTERLCLIIHLLLINRQKGKLDP